ncbi:MAG TPA: cbb3-type cytochrome c oxidase subunit I [Pseudomonadales bacterium]
MVMTTGGSIATVAGARQKLALGWLWLAVYSLVSAGLMAVLLALSRTPLIEDLLENPALFKVALVVHVDLSAVIWFFACAGALWSVLAPGARGRADHAAFALMAIGTLMITAAPFVGAVRPLMNNYVPVLRHPWFFIGLVAATAGVALQASRYLRASRNGRAADDRVTAVLHPALELAAGVFLVAIYCVLVSLAVMPDGVRGEAYYELLFWGGGHVLQFAYTLMLLGAWLALAIAAGARPALPERTLRAAMLLVVVPLAVVPWLYAAPLDAPRHVRGFTELMRWGGLACLPLGLMAVRAVWRAPAADTEGRRLRAAALCSIGLFAAGGLLGFLIRGSNTMVPAHYHGSVVAVTMALMGLVYYALPRLGRPIVLPRTALWQPYVYSIGQLMHVTGLAWCGGYGVQRKVAGAAQGLDGLGETAGMALMGLGGVVSVAGGMMFLLVALTALAGPLVMRASSRRRSDLQIAIPDP